MNFHMRLLREHHTTIIPEPHGGEGVIKHTITKDRLQYATMMKEDCYGRYTPIWEDVDIVEEYTQDDSAVEAVRSAKLAARLDKLEEEDPPIKREKPTHRPAAFTRSRLTKRGE